MVLNPGKWHFMSVSKNVSDSELLNSHDLILKNCREVEILSITLDLNWNFRSRKVCQKLSVFIRISSYNDTNKKAVLYKSMIND